MTTIAEFIMTAKFFNYNCDLSAPTVHRAAAWRSLSPARASEPPGPTRCSGDPSERRRCAIIAS